MVFSRYCKIVFIASTYSVASCSMLFGNEGIFRGKSKDYLKTGELKSIEVPQEFNSRSLESLYAIPDVRPRDEFGDYVTLGNYNVPRPDAINTEKGKVGVKLQKLGSDKWIFLNASTSQVWPRTQNFLSQYGIGVATSNPAIGLIETADVVFKDSPDRKSRYRIFIEKGVHPETTEVHILHTEFDKAQEISTDFVWPDISHSVDRERALLDELANVLAENVNNNAASLLGQNVGGDLKVEFLKNKAEPTMRLRLVEERAKATIAHALERDGFLLWEELSSEGLYYVGFYPEYNGKNGMFGWLFGNSFPKKAPYSIDRLLRHLSSGDDVKETFSRIKGVQFGEPLPKALGLLVVVGAADNGMDVIVRDFRGRRLPPAEAKAMLRVIRKNLI